MIAIPGPQIGSWEEYKKGDVQTDKDCVDFNIDSMYWQLINLDVSNFEYLLLFSSGS